jgi:hypothetical protein
MTYHGSVIYATVLRTVSPTFPIAMDPDESEVLNRAIIGIEWGLGDFFG